MLVVPLQPVPSQTVSAILNNQPCAINVYQVATGLYVDLSVNNVPIIGGVSALNANYLVRNTYLGFVGDLAFFDNLISISGSPQDPVYTGLGTQFVLMYIFPGGL